MSEPQGVTSQQIYNMLMESQYWPPEQMQAYQRSQLEQLLRHAKANVPFYKTRLDCMFRRDGSIDWDRWEEIPIVTREDLRDRREEMQAKVLPPGHGPTKAFASSGSSGVPITFTTTALSSVVRRALLRRASQLQGLLQIARVAKYNFRLPDGSHMDVPFKWIHDPADQESSTGLYIDRRLSEEAKLEIMRKNRADIYTDFATSVVLAARANMLIDQPVSLKAVVTYGMGLTDAELEIVEASFSCHVHSIYSSKECGLIGFTCPQCRRYHLCPEAVLFETQDAQPGSQFAAIFTPIFNTAQPLVRYKQGDILFDYEMGYGSGPCNCGTQLPSIAKVAGRADSYFLFDGKQVPIVGIEDAVLAKHLRALAVQISQVGPEELEVRYIPTVQPKKRALQAVTSHLRDCFRRPLSIRFSSRGALPLTAGGKQQRYCREWPNQIGAPADA